MRPAEQLPTAGGSRPMKAGVAWMQTVRGNPMLLEHATLAIMLQMSGGKLGRVVVGSGVLIAKVSPVSRPSDRG